MLRMSLGKITWGPAAGWIGGGWLLGIAGHSWFPYQPVPFHGVVFGMALVTSALVTIRRPVIRLVLLCLLGVCLGLWRFDLAILTLPGGLRPLDAKHMAWSSGRSPLPAALSRPLASLREEVHRRAEALFTTDEAALITGLVYGERDLSSERKEDFRRAGLLHIVVVSGSNVTILVVLVMRILMTFGWRRRTTFIAVSTALVLYVGLVGFSPPVVRAAIMGWLVLLAPMVGRLPRSSRLLLLSAVLFTFWHPWALLFDASFALSFLAMWGLLAWTPLIDRALARLPAFLREATSTTVGATVMTLPYSAWAFSQVSVIGLLTNPVVLPLVPWAMGTGSLAMLFPRTGWLVLPAKGFLQFILGVAALSRRLPWGAWDEVLLHPVTMLGWYVFLWILWRKWKHSTHVPMDGVDRSGHEPLRVGDR